MGVDRQGRPRLGDKKTSDTVDIRVYVTREEKEADSEEALKVGVVSTSSGNPNVAQLYRTMRAYWYALPVKERKEFVKSLEKEKYNYPNTVIK